MNAPVPPAEARRIAIAQMRDSAWNIGDTARIHLELMLGSLSVNDDLGAVLHMHKAVAAVKGAARCLNEISTLRWEREASAIDDLPIRELEK